MQLFFLSTLQNKSLMICICICWYKFDVCIGSYLRLNHIIWKYIVLWQLYLKAILWYSIYDFLFPVLSSCHSKHSRMSRCTSVPKRTVQVLASCCLSANVLSPRREGSAGHCRHSSADIISLRRERPEEAVLSICSRFGSWNSSIFSNLNGGICDGRSSWYLKVQGGWLARRQRDTASDTVTGSDSSHISINCAGQLHLERTIVLCCFLPLPDPYKSTGQHHYRLEVMWGLNFIWFCFFWIFKGAILLHRRLGWKNNHGKIATIWDL